MALSFVGQNNNNGNSTTLTCDFSPNPTTGNGLIAFIATADQTSTVTQIGDSLGNSWIPAVSAAGNGLSAFCYYVSQCLTSTGTNTFGIAVSTSGGYMEIELYEIAPGSGFNAILLDQSLGTSSTAPTMGPTGTLATASEFALAYAIGFGPVSAGVTGWTQTILPSDDLSVYQVTSATTALSVTWNYGGSPTNSGVIVTFQGSSAGGVVQVASDSIATGSAAVATAKVQHKGTDPIGTRAALVVTAKHNANATVAI